MTTQAKIQLSVDGSSQVISEFDRVESKVGKLGDTMDRFKSQLAVLGVGLGVTEIARLSDEYTKFTAQLKLATNGQTEYANAHARVRDVAKASQSDLASTGVLYARIANGTRELGVSQQKVGDITEALTLSLKVSGATQAESASAMLQLSQAFASGALRGEEFNAVNEAAPRVMKALADGLGVPIGSLREMAKEGKITSQIMADALPQALGELRKEAAQVQTISGAMTNLKNNVLEMVGAQAQQNGSAAALAGTINLLANNLNLVTAAAMGITAASISNKLIDMAVSAKASVVASTELAAAKARESAASIAAAEANVAETTSKLAQLTETRVGIIAAREDTIAKLGVANAAIAQAQAQIQAATSAGALSTALAVTRQGEINLTAAMQARAIATTELALLGRQQAAVAAQTTAATVAATAAQAGLSTTVGAASVGTGLLARAVGLLGGPIGMITTALGIGVTAWMAWGNKSKESNEIAKESVKDSTDAILKSLDAQIAKHEKIIGLREKGASLDEAKKLAENKNRAQLEVEGKGLADLMSGQGEYKNKTLSNEDKLFERMRILERIADLTKKINEEEAKGEKANGITRDEKLKSWFDQNGTSAQRMAAEMAKLKKEFGEIPPEMEKLIRKKYEEKSSTVAQTSSYHNLIDSIQGKINVTKMDIATVGKVLESDKIRAKMDADRASKQPEYTEAQRKQIELKADQLAVQEKLLKQANLIDKMNQQAHEDNIRFAESLGEITTKLQDQVLAQEDHNNKIGLTKTALADLEVAQLNEDAEKKESIATTMDAIDWSGKLGDEYRAQAAALRDLAKAKKEGASKEADFDLAQTKLKEIHEDSKRFYDDLYRGLSDSLYRGFESGKGFGKSFMDGIKNLFKTTVLKIAVQGVMTGVLGMGASGMANAQGLPSTGMGIMQSVSAGKSLWDSFSAAAGAAGMAGSMGAGIAGFGNLIGSSTISAFGSGMGLSTAAASQAAGAYGAAGMAGTGSAISAGSSVAAAMPYVAAALAVGAILKKGLSMGDKQMSGQTVAGNLGTNDLSRNVSWTQKGGFLRSDRSGIWSYNLANSTAIQDGKAYQDSASLGSDQAMLKGLNAGYDALKKASADFAKQLGLSADVVTSRTDAMSFKIGATQADTDKAIAEMFAGIGDNIARALLPSIGELSKEGEGASATLARVAGNVGSVNSIFSDLGLKMYELNIAGYKSASMFTELMGGMDSMKQITASYYQNFYSEEERKASAMKLLTAEFEKQNQVIPASREAYRALVEQVRQTGTPEQLAGLLKLNGAFAELVKETEAIASAVTVAANLASEAQALSERRFAADRKAAVAALNATQAIEAQAKATQDLARVTAQKDYDDNLQARLRAGKVGEIMSAAYSLNPVDMTSYVGASGFDAGGFNAALMEKQAKQSLELIKQASADAISVDDIGSVLAELFDFTKGQNFRSVLRQHLPTSSGLANDVGYVMFDFIEASLEGIRLEQYAANGAGVASVMFANDQLNHQTNLMTQYNRSINSANELLRLNIITQADYASAMAKADVILKEQVKSQDELAASLKQAGVDSIAFYFDQIGLSVNKLNEAAAKAAEPLALVSSSIGRLGSIGSVFAMSAAAAQEDSSSNAYLVSEYANKAAQTLTTQSAAQAAQVLAEKAAFADQSAAQLRGFSMLIEGVKQFDSNSVEASFLRISDALNAGMIDQAQYKDLFSASMEMFEGVESESKKFATSMSRLGDSMKSFSDQLRIDIAKNALNPNASRDELMRQYEASRVSAMAGDESAAALYQSLAKELMDVNRYQSQSEFNAVAGRIYADAENLHYFAASAAQNKGENVVTELKALNENLSKKVEKLEDSLMQALAQIAKNTRDTATQIEVSNIT